MQDLILNSQTLTPRIQKEQPAKKMTSRNYSKSPPTHIMCSTG